MFVLYKNSSVFIGVQAVEFEDSSRRAQQIPDVRFEHIIANSKTINIKNKILKTC